MLPLHNVSSAPIGAFYTHRLIFSLVSALIDARVGGTKRGQSVLCALCVPYFSLLSRGPVHWTGLGWASISRAVCLSVSPPLQFPYFLFQSGAGKCASESAVPASTQGRPNLPHHKISLSVSSSFFARSLSCSSYHEPVLSSWLLSNLVCFCLVRSRLVLSRPVLASPSTTTALHAPVT